MEIGILTHHRIRGSRMSEFYIQDSAKIYQLEECRGILDIKFIYRQNGEIDF